MGAWIEIFNSEKEDHEKEVAPFMGAWIEMKLSVADYMNYWCRSLHGSVD